MPLWYDDRWPPELLPGAIVMPGVGQDLPHCGLPHNLEPQHGRGMPRHGALAAAAGVGASTAVDDLDLDTRRRGDQAQRRTRGSGDGRDRCRTVVGTGLDRTDCRGDRRDEHRGGRGCQGHWGHGVLLCGRPSRGHLADHSLVGRPRSAPCSFEPGIEWCRWPSHTWALLPCDTTLDNHGVPQPER
jgi:hypothetical protein